MSMKNSLPFCRWLFMALLVAGPGIALADDPLTSGVERIQRDWAVIKYQTAEKDQATAYAKLGEEAHKLSERYPGRAEPLVWESIVLSSHAGALRGFSKMKALGMVKRARDLLLEAEEIDPEALDGSIHTSLGALYYQVPGWPLGFGDEDKAREYLDKALRINPEGIDPNFFLGELLYEQGQYAESLQVLEKAKAAPPRPAREVADRGRHKEIDDLVAEVRRFL